MSQSTELPDLDLDLLEALARAADQGEGQHVYTHPRDSNGWKANEAWHRAASPAVFLDLIVLARRAQPEGEAPQAEHPTIAAVRGLAWKWHCDAAEQGFATSEPAVELFELLDTAPAAQHAAPATASRDAHQLASLILQDPDGGRMVISSALESGADGAMWFTATNPETRAAARITISIEHDYDPTAAAQHAESGAQAGDEAVELLAAVFDAWENGIDCYEYPESNAGYLGMAFKLDGDVFQRCVDLLNRENPPRNVALAAQSQGAQPTGEFRTCCEHPDRSNCAGRGGYYRLAAKAEAPTHCDPAEGFCAACRDQARAQQAAAPGALDAEPPRMTTDEAREYLVKFTERHFTDKTFHRYIRNDQGNRQGLAGDFAWQMARALRMLEVAPSAPGTPEAPAVDADGALLRTVVEHGMQLHFEGRGEEDAVWVDDLMNWSDGDRLGATRALIAEAAKQRAAQLDTAPEAPKGGA